MLEKIETKIKGFEKYDIQNGFRAVKWCMDHDLIQQAVTMLWENIITWVLAEEKIDWSVRKNRIDASKAIHFLSHNPEETDSSVFRLVEKFKKNKVLTDICGQIESLRVLRNDLHHGGFVMERNNRAKSHKSIREQFKIIYQKVQFRLF